MIVVVWMLVASLVAPVVGGACCCTETTTSDATPAAGAADAIDSCCSPCCEESPRQHDGSTHDGAPDSDRCANGCDCIECGITSAKTPLAGVLPVAIGERRIGTLAEASASIVARDAATELLRPPSA